MSPNNSTQIMTRIRHLSLMTMLSVGIAISLVPAQVIYATTITVTNTGDSGPGSLRQAIANAVAGDTIVFDPSLKGRTITLTSGQLTIGKNLTISGPGAHDLTISGGNTYRVFSVSSGARAAISGLTIAKGYVRNAKGGGISNAGTLTLEASIVTDNVTDDYLLQVYSCGGGGIYNSGTLTIRHSTISNNRDDGYSAGGGGIYNEGNLILDNSIVQGNGAHSSSFFGQYGGGGIYNSGTLDVSHSTIIGNTAAGYSSGGGGGIYNDGSLGITYSAVTSNNADNTFGGGIFNMISGTLTMEYSTITGNRTAQDGGGIENAGTLTVTHSTISGNEAHGTDFGGGGIDNTNGLVTVENSTISTNRADMHGGGLLNYDGRVTLIYCTVSGNTASGGGGIYLMGTVTDTTMYLANTIVANSTAGGDCVNNSIVITNASTLIEDNTCTPNLSGDPRLGPLQDNGGDTQTHVLQPGSPAIDQGSCTGITTDQRGYPRPVDIPDIPNAGSGCDIGAFEIQETDLLPIKTVDDDNPGPGQEVTYKITVQNVGFLTATNALISDTIPNNLSLAGPITLDPPDAGTTGVPPTLVSGLVLAAGERITVTFPVAVTQPLAGGTVITNTAAVTSTEMVTPKTGSVSITVRNVAPVAADDSASTNEDTPVTIHVLGNDSDMNGDVLSISAVGIPVYGGVAINGVATVIYTPTNRTVDYTDVFTYAVSDGSLIATARVTVNVSADNDAPTASADVVTSTNEDTPISGNITASDPDTNDTLGYSVTSNPLYGSANVNGITGAWVYTPANRMAGYVAVFTITVADTGSHTGIARVTVNVSADNDPPTVSDTITTTNEDTPISGGITASDPDTNDTLSYSLSGSPAYGSVSVNGVTGAWAYTPTNRTANYAAVFTVTVADTGSHTGIARVTVNVSANNDPPTTSNIVTATNEDTPISGGITASDPDTNDTLSYSLTGGPTYGSANVNGITGAWVYTPTNRTANYVAVFTVTVTDSGHNTATARVTVNVSADNDAPTASADVVTSTNEDTPISGKITASDPDTNDTLGYSVTSNPLYGSANVNGITGAWVYTPTNRMAGYTAVFTITVADTGSHTDAVKITVNVSADNDPPTVSDIVTTANEDTPISGGITASDPDTNDTLSYSLSGVPAYGSVSVNGITGAWAYTPTNRMANYAAVFTVTVADTGGHTGIARVTVNVSANNDPPTTSNIVTATNEDTPISGGITASDPDTNDTLSYSLTGGPTYGSAGVNGITGAWAYTPTNRTANYAAVFTVTVADTGGRTGIARVTVNVSADNDPPAFTSTPVTTGGKGILYTYSVITTDPDTDDTLTISALTKPNWLNLTDNGDGGAILYGTPTLADVSSHLVELEVKDHMGRTDTQHFSITVTINIYLPLMMRDY